MVERQKEKYGWEIIFLGANIDAISTAARVGISADRAANYHADGEGTRLNYEAVSRAVSEIRANRPVADSWKAEDCVLLPVGERNRFTKWNVPRKRPKRAAYGFGSANVWFADNPETIAKEYVKKIITYINDYDGDNWLRKQN